MVEARMGCRRIPQEIGVDLRKTPILAFPRLRGKVLSSPSLAGETERGGACRGPRRRLHRPWCSDVVGTCAIHSAVGSFPVPQPEGRGIFPTRLEFRDPLYPSPSMGEVQVRVKMEELPPHFHLSHKGRDERERIITSQGGRG